MANLTLIVRLASRNLLLNARRSLLVGSLIVLAVVITVIGGSLFDSTLAGLKRTFIDSFTGELFVSPKSDRPLSLFGVDTPVIGAYAKIPTMLHYEKVLDTVKRQPGLSSSVPQVSGYALLEKGGTRLPVVLFGVDGSDYFKAFPAVKVIVGKPLTTGVPGVMISRGQAAEIGSSSGHALAPGDLIKLTAFTSHGFTIREVPLAGIFAFPIRNTLLDRIAYVDADTLRSLNGMVQGSVDLAKLPAADARFLTGDLANVFNSDPTVTEHSPGIGIADVVRSLADTEARNRAVTQTAGSWNFILIKLKPGTNPTLFQRKLEVQLRKNGLDVVVKNWKAAAGTGAALSSSLSVAFDAGLLLLGVVIIFVLVNTLVIWVTQRTGEIGTIRALGGSRGFIFELFLTEATILSFLSGVVGLILGSAIVLWMQRRGFVIDNRILELVFGGTTLRPALTAKTLAMGFLGALAIGGVGAIFPIRLALKVQPLRAMDSE